MNGYQVGFLILILFPPVFSIVLDKLSDRVKVVGWIKWSDSIWIMYLLDWVFLMFLLVFALLVTV